MAVSAASIADYSCLISFVKPAVENLDSLQRWNSSSEHHSCQDGEEARQFYEQLCSSETANDRASVKNGSSGILSISRNSRKPSWSKNIERNRRISHSSSVSVNSSNGDMQNKYLLDINKVNPENRECNILHSASQAQVSPIVKSSDSESSATRSTINRKRTGSVKVVSQRVKEHRQAELLRHAQNGDVEAVKSLLKLSVDVDEKDVFGWTAFMTASFGGHMAVVQCLAEAGADLNVLNGQGQSAFQLAEQSNHLDIAHFIKTFGKMDRKNVKSLEEIQPILNPFFCDVCKVKFTDTDQTAHALSTVHLFNLGRKPNDNGFLIPPTNPGYRMLVKKGWNTERGLGPFGQGQKFPVKTVLKYDRKCLGSGRQETPRITHFKPFDKSAVSKCHGVAGGSQRMPNVRTLSRRAQRAKEKRARQREIELRRQLD